MTSGDATLADQPNDSGSSGANDGGGNIRGNTDLDVTILRVDLDVPVVANCLTLDFRFLSEEFPEYVGSSVNDAFIAELDDSNWTTEDSVISAPNNFAFDAAGFPVSVNTAGMTAGESAGTTYDGATPLLSASTPVTPGPHQLYLSIFDQGDNFFDSAVFVDALVLGTTGPGGCQPGATVVSMDKIVDDPTVGPGDQVTYTITITNDSASAVDLDSISDTLPDGFAYVSGSTSGATTANPGISGQTLTWDEEVPYTVPGDGQITLVFSATASSTPGTYFNNASADAETSGVSVTPTGPDAPVTVEGTEPETGNIVIQKATNPECDPTVFSFTASYDGDGFQLAGCEQNDSGPLAPGAYSVSETPLAGWELVDTTCSDGSDVTAIDLDAGETVTCTFTNDQQPGTIVVAKETDPDGDPQGFEFTTDYTEDFSLSDGDSHETSELSPGTYSVSETLPDGWEQTSATCDDESDPSAIDLDAGETVICTFTNTKLVQTGTIVVEKQTLPDGDPTLFDFTTSYGPGFSLSDGQTNTAERAPGTYAVSEDVPEGWLLFDATCDDGSPVNNISLQAGETVTCTFENWKQGHIIVQKETDPDGDPTVFDFQGDGLGEWQLSDGQSHDTGPINPGTWFIQEIDIPAGWELTSATCDDDSDPSAIDLDPGETVTCTFVNTFVGGGEGTGNIVVEKQTTPDGATQQFPFTTTYGPAFSLADGEQSESGPLPPGTYTISELVAPGWVLESIDCGGSFPVIGGSSVTVTLSAGENITCVFENVVAISPPATSARHRHLLRHRHLHHRHLRHRHRHLRHRHLHLRRLHHRHHLRRRRHLRHRQQQAQIGPPGGGREPGTVKFPNRNSTFRPTSDQVLPNGTIVDVSNGRGVTITDRNGNEMLFYGQKDGVPSKFVVFTVKGVIELRLTGGNFKACGTRRIASVAQANGKPVRRVWGKGKGKFRTKGRYAAATVRGTWWLTADFCKYTLVRVAQGSVTAQNLRTKKFQVVKAPKSYTARPGKP